MKRPVFVLLLVAEVFCISVFHQTGAKLVAAETSLKKTDNGYEVDLDGKLFAEYRTNWNGTPILWPVIGPNEKPMTRSYPMSDDNPSEVKDHPHHRSLWFTHDGVNGNNFWTTGTIAHQEFSKAECDGKTATLVTKNHWIDAKTKETVCSDVRTMTFGTINHDHHELRYIDFDVTLTAEQKTVTIADTKEGTFGIRVPSSVAVDAKKKDAKLGGTIVNAQGDKNDDAWGKRSEWVDYSGPVDGETAGIAVMNHPTSFRFPTWWHVRTYGLFAANPFGIRDFEPSLNQDGTITLKKGDSLTFRYRVILHRGDATAVDLPKLFKDYAAR
ncbi:MAG: PmoA family protein [Planctomycetaceae bacterium]|nr:PmoA family protein [Planctomycetaceae bacterium]